MDISVFLSGFSMILMLFFGLLIPFIFILLQKRFEFGAIFVAFVFIIDTITMGDMALDIGLKLYYPDIFLILLSLAAITRLLFSEDVPHKNRAWLTFCFFFFVSLMTGIATFGSSAGVDARPYFYFVVTGLYGVSFYITEERIQLTFNVLTATAFFLIGLTVYRWFVYYTPIASLLPAKGFYNNDGAIRVVYSNHALLIAQVLVSVFFFASASRGFSIARKFTPVLLAMVLVLQHRSVWLATMIGVLTRFLVGKAGSGLKSGQLIYLIAVIAVTAVPLLFSDKLSSVSQQIGSGASSALAAEGSAGERLQSWREIIKNWAAAGPRSIFIGQSFGSDNTRYVKDEFGKMRKINYTAHNLYVQTLFNTGIIGLLAILGAYWFLMTRLYRLYQQGEDKPLAETLLVLMTMQLVYYIPYGVDYFQSLLFGIALAYVSSKKVAPVAPQAQSPHEKANV